MTLWQGRKARRNAMSKSGVGAVVPRLPATSYSFLLEVTTMVQCIAGLCGVALCLMRFMTPYSEVLVSYWNLHVRRRLGAQDLQIVADMVGVPISLHNEQESRLVFSFLGGVLVWTARAAGRRMGVGSTSLMSCLTQMREQCPSGFVSGCCYVVSTTARSRYG